MAIVETIKDGFEALENLGVEIKEKRVQKDGKLYVGKEYAGEEVVYAIEPASEDVRVETGE